MPKPNLCKPLRELEEIETSLNALIQQHTDNQTTYSKEKLANEMHLHGGLQRAGAILHHLRRQNIDELVQNEIDSSGAFFTRGKTKAALEAWNRYSYYSFIADITLKAAFVYKHSTLNQLESEYIIPTLQRSLRYSTHMLNMLFGQSKSQELIIEIGDEFEEVKLIVEATIKPLSTLNKLLTQYIYGNIKDIECVDDLTFRSAEREKKHNQAVHDMIKKTKDVVELFSVISENLGDQFSDKLILCYNQIISMRADAIRARAFDHLKQDQFESAHLDLTNAALLYEKIIHSTLDPALKEKALENHKICKNYFSDHFENPEELLGSRWGRQTESGRKRVAKIEPEPEDETTLTVSPEKPCPDKKRRRIHSEIFKPMSEPSAQQQKNGLT